MAIGKPIRGLAGAAALWATMACQPLVVAQGPVGQSVTTPTPTDPPRRVYRTVDGKEFETAAARLAYLHAVSGARDDAIYRAELARQERLSWSLAAQQAARRQVGLRGAEQRVRQAERDLRRAERALRRAERAERLNAHGYPNALSATASTRDLALVRRRAEKATRDAERATARAQSRAEILQEQSRSQRRTARRQARLAEAEASKADNPPNQETQSRR